ncbi:Acyl-CoA dehydrogenase [Albimonas donghaensis]|uniref:Acyl-CoA dehydrogenase n=1 Tax=Albimonas donghaensis TaxID=356660 RepID=A0A1H3DT39_9RHOB|nr:acyl-CoA dehydrogenase family protein [Albimonas donghaensis]SDX69702.1 Acyl-CoA dehydrogenase [Albimonas donghaensis]
MTVHATGLTPDRAAIRDHAREFVRREILPQVRALDNAQADIPMAMREKLAEMGYFGLLIPEEYGGLGLGCYEYCLVSEELSRAWMSVGSIIVRGNLLIGAQAMSEEMRRRYLPRMATGEMVGAFAMSEPDAGSDVAGLKTRAVKDGDSYRITGNKYWCTFAREADFLIVVARTSPAPEGKRHRGLSMFMIEKPRGEFPEGISGAPIPKIGYFGMKTYELAFDEFVVGADQMIGEEGQGFYYATQGLECARAQTGARSVGVARGALEDAVAYSQERVQFGNPISAFQETRFKIARMASDIEAGRALVYDVADKIDTGTRCDREAAMAKYFCTEMSERVASDALQIHGGAGYTKLHDVERHWRDARLTKLFEGTSEIQLRVISDSILGRG